MNPTKTLHNLGQSLWLDNITRDLLTSGMLQRYIEELSVTGLTSNPTIFDHAIKNSADYDSDIARFSHARPAEDLFFELALADLTRAADLLRPVFTRTNGVDGWVSLEVSPVLARDTQRTIAAARDLSRRGSKSNLFIKIPGTKRRVARDRGRDLCRCPDQCHASILAGAIYRRGRSLSPRGRTAHRSWS